MLNIPLLILAAGQASRMHTQKLLLPWGKSTMIEHVVETALSLEHYPVYVVTGSDRGKINEVLLKYPITVVENPSWGYGMGDSIAKGVSAITEDHPTADAIMVLLGDQPMVDKRYLTYTLSKFKVGIKRIVVSSYPGGWQGVPAVFDPAYFNHLKELKKSSFGAKLFLRDFLRFLRPIDYKKILRDIDTPEDYKEFIKKYPPNRQS